MIRGGRTLHLLNGVTSEMTSGSGIAAKVSGGCEHYLDWPTCTQREATAEELLRCIRLGEQLPEVAFVGNPIVLRKDFGGAPIEERMRRLKTAALIAKHTKKLGSVEVWSEREIDYLVEIGIIARGSRERYFAEPCFVTAKETISPLFLDGRSGDILLALAARGLPCTIIPMPISGISAPVSMLGNAILANAEILGVMTAIRSAHPDALVGGGTISGILDMKTSVVSFSAPEAILQDIAVAEVHERLYGLDYLIGSGYTDAKGLTGQTLVEKTQKFFMTRLAQRRSYPIGLLYGGSVFSAEQAVVDLEICRSLEAGLRPVDGFPSVDELVDLIGTTGPNGNFVEADHTLSHFRDNFLPRVFDRSGAAPRGEGEAGQLYRNAHDFIDGLLGSSEPWQIGGEQSREIDRVLASAEKAL